MLQVTIPSRLCMCLWLGWSICGPAHGLLATRSRPNIISHCVAIDGSRIFSRQDLHGLPHFHNDTGVAEGSIKSLMTGESGGDPLDKCDEVRPVLDCAAKLRNVSLDNQCL